MSGGVPLGLLSPCEYTAHTVELGPNPCTIFCYTDGVVEAMKNEDEFFGQSHTFDVLNATTDLDPAGMIASLRSAITDFCAGHPQSDDITMLAVHLP